MTWSLWFGLVLCLLVVFAGLGAYGAKRWANTTRTLTGALDAARIGDQVQPLSLRRYDSRELDGLPAPVQRYFRAVLKEGQPIVAAAMVEATGSFNLSATAEQWKPFTSTQRIVTQRPGFLWNARVVVLPGLPALAVDSYIAGRGLLQVAMLGLFTVADMRGSGDIARGQFMRFFAEAAWYPTALLPSQGVQWQAVDDHSANATLVDGSHTLTLLFRFNDASLIDSVRAEARGAVVGKEIIMLPWEGKWFNYQTRDGMTVPFTCEVAWMWPDGRKPYFRGSVTALRYEYAA
ncbi:DUF6544 family protein [Rhodoferax sp.]|uniref:DUF6920 family protein n=1 Tax=Rhodoferax sp. TaxID=50421 RepID=UPI00263813D8|nr:DUF6544 family protein [Rhodoferax sp.]MDD2924079.1 hypothetical protein [Rhodoferax sp.]